MWSKSYSKRVRGISAEKIWAVWTDVNQWHTWHDDIEWAKLEGQFKVGDTFKLKPKGGPEVSIRFIKIEPGQQFTDLTCFPGARMFGCHEFITHGDELELRTTISIEGFLSFVWRKLVAEKVANGLVKQTGALIEKAKRV
jgi:hypothetical protein